MPLSLSDKLKSMGVQVGARNLSPQPRRQMPADYPIEQVVSGQLQLLPAGNVFVSETAFSSEYRHGRVGLWPEAPLDTIAAWARETRLTGYLPEQFAFLDTETTGLAGGTGTYAFLIGVARFEGDTFHLAQFFMRDPAEEPAQLSALTGFLQPCRALVTFNGKSFDGPLLNSRYTLNGMKSPLPALAHLDLLPLARRLWRDRLPSRRLGDLETDILLAKRSEEDVPGFLIPQIYFDYLRGGDARPLKSVFYHNRLDVAAMAALLNQMAQMLEDPLGKAVEHALDLIAIGKLLEAIGQPDAAARLFITGLERNDLPEEHYRIARNRLSFLEKRRGNWGAAIEVWQQAAAGRQIYAHVELAKYYEHRQKDFDKAARWTEAALNIVNRPTASRAEHRKWLGELKHRLARLQGKIEKRKSIERKDK